MGTSGQVGSARQREKRARVREDGADKPGPRGSEREREGAQVGADRWGPPVRHPRARGHGLSGPTWAELAFLFSKEFLITFLFIFSRVFNSNSNQVSNSNQIKHVQHFMTHMVLPKIK
jgi:hypothetical protein